MQRSKRSRLAALLMIGVPIALGGCIARNGALQPNTQFVFPNSNVEVIGPVSASIKKKGYLIFVPSFTPEEIMGVYDEALAGQPGANVVVNFEEETVVSNFLLINEITYSVRGDGASMAVGQQILR